MMNRMTAALWAVLLVAGPVFAQEIRNGGSSLTYASEAPVYAPVAGNYGTYADPGAFWVTGEFFLAWFRGGDVPPLVTTSPPGTSRTAAGVLGAAGTSVLFGDTSMNEEVRFGLKFGAGVYLDEQRNLSLETGFMIVESQADVFAIDSTGILARPFNTSGADQQSILIAFPGTSTGSVDASVNSGNLYEAHIDLTEVITRGPWGRLEGLVGYRLYRYDEGLHVRQTIVPTDPNFVPGTRITSVDEFAVHNVFHGVDLGLRSQFDLDPVTVTLLGKLAVGQIGQEVSVRGSNLVTVPGAGSAFNTGGLLALADNIGNHENTEWAVFPEFGVTLGWQVNPNVRVTLGYSLLVLNGIVRAGNEVDLMRNPNLFPPADPAAVNNTVPGIEFIRTDMWMQSINLGAAFAF
jgi:hypothetical protein